MAALLQVRGDHRHGSSSPSCYELDGHLPRDGRGALQALPGLRRQAERDPRAGSATSTSAAANQVYSELRALKVDLTFAIGGIKNHEIYFEHLGGGGGDPTGPIGELIERDFGSVRGLARRPEGDRDGRPRLGLDRVRLGRGTALQLRRRRQNTYPVWNATPLVALDVYEHAYFLDFGTDRASYIEAFFENIDWGDRGRLGGAVRHPDLAPDDNRSSSLAGYVRGLYAVRVLAPMAGQGRRHPAVRQREHRRLERVARLRRRLGVPVVLLDVAKGFVPAFVARSLRRDLAGGSPGLRRCCDSAAACSCVGGAGGSRRDVRRCLPRSRARSSAWRAPSSGSSCSSYFATPRSHRWSRRSRCRC